MRLKAELAEAVALGRQLLREERGVATGAERGQAASRGFYLEFSLPSSETMRDAVQRLEYARSGIELVAVSAKSIENEDGVLATVFVPERKAQHFDRRIDAYRLESTRAGKPKHEALFASVSSVRLATPRSVFTDDLRLFPDDVNQELWWELWIRDGFEQQIDSVAERCDIAVKPHVVHFPERHVKLVRASLAKLERAMRLSDAVAELRIAKDTPSFFLRESNNDLGQWIEALLERLPGPLTAEGPEVAVCILDGGVAQAHPLLEPRIDPSDVLSVNPNWSGAEDHGAKHAGHGTGMVGLSLYGDLAEALPGNDAIVVGHRAESVKILPPTGVNEPENFAAITLQAIGRAETNNPQRHRIICTAVTAEESGANGKPSAWSSAVDQATFGAFGEPRLAVVSAGNIRERTVSWNGSYLDRNDLAQVESPGQAWNALTVGAFTEKINLLDPVFAGWRALAPAGDLCPASRTAISWDSQWPAKPDVVFEGGNYAHDGADTIDTPDDLQLLTTGHRLQYRLVAAFGDTSAATALGARFAANVAAARPRAWAETVRGLIVHSAEWTSEMHQRVQALPGVSRKRVLMRRYGYGVPDLPRAIRSAKSDLTLVVEDSLRPFAMVGSEVKTHEMKIHRLPWPQGVLESLGETPVEMRVTLSYFIEPNPGERGWSRRHRYASHGLRFEVKDQLETDDAFLRRLSSSAVADDHTGVRIPVAPSSGWFLGPRARNSGSIHSDRWTGTAIDLSRRGALGVYPASGWWRDLKALERFNEAARYSLIVSIRVPERDVDIYTPVSVALGVPLPVATAVEIEN